MKQKGVLFYVFLNKLRLYLTKTRVFFRKNHF